MGAWASGPAEGQGEEFVATGGLSGAGVVAFIVKLIAKWVFPEKRCPCRFGILLYFTNLTGVLAFVDWFGLLPHRPLFAGKSSSEIQIDDLKNPGVLQKLLGVACFLLITQWDGMEHTF